MEIHRIGVNINQIAHQTNLDKKVDFRGIRAFLKEIDSRTRGI
ncbi:plasmid mobilization relaxosome protein MobC [Bifidobacterium boum]|nr:plasmid mobilization relaxosome protein MobC [Bifidobacterium boum]